MTTWEALRRLVDELPDSKLATALQLVESLREGEEGERLSPEDLEAVRRGLEDIRAGRVKRLEDLRRELDV